ncbi:hypothetical protein [Deinococcus marmoris]|uniref:Choice-of-anchor D domain-containing protein n=1 Tax=Deinococcus marmoris TaxID=249408 RepID=A0A1U7NV66_9DEIO|nr:hypothetical protein [Deinococcus marmoris]OLV16809.1 hypothetical protein BOO71_0010636 [Deinococcus marmoris]
MNEPTNFSVLRGKRRWRPGRWTLAALLALTTGCAQPQAEVTPPSEIKPPSDVKPPVEQPITKPLPPADILLNADPGLLVFSGTRDGTGAGASAVQTVAFENSSGAAVKLTGLTFLGDAGTFELVSPPAFPQTLLAGASLNLKVKLLPGAATGVLRSTLRAVGDNAPVGEVNLSGLRAVGLEGSNEPPLAQIVDALNYGTNVGSSALILGTGAGLIGDEVAAPMFERASAGPVTLRPVARYSPDGPSAYGSFVLDGGAVRSQERAAMVSSAHNQTLNPPLQSGQTAFDPGSAAFGIYLAPNDYAKQATYTLDRLNAGPTRHAVRAYPLKDRAGKVVPNSYLLAFEPSENGDYQDVVFVLENVRPVAAQ